MVKLDEAKAVAGCRTLHIGIGHPQWHLQLHLLTEMESLGPRLSLTCSPHAQASRLRGSRSNYADVGGFDAAHKLTILWQRIAFGAEAGL